MPRVIKIMVEKINPEPSIEDMKAFGVKYSKSEWELITSNRDFLNIFTKDLNKSKKLADVILKNEKKVV